MVFEIAVREGLCGIGGLFNGFWVEWNGGGEDSDWCRCRLWTLTSVCGCGRGVLFDGFGFGFDSGFIPRGFSTGLSVYI